MLMRQRAHVPIVVCVGPPSSASSISLWQVSWRSLAFLELQSIFNPVAPLPDGPAIYGPESRAGGEWLSAQGLETQQRWQHDGWVLSKMRESTMERERERDRQRDREREVEDRRAQWQPVSTLFPRVFIDQLWLSSAERCSSCMFSWFAFEESVLIPLRKWSTASESPTLKILLKAKTDSVIVAAAVATTTGLLFRFPRGSNYQQHGTNHEFIHLLVHLFWRQCAFFLITRSS